MANLSKDLKKLFYAHLENAKKPKYNVGGYVPPTTPVTHRPPYQPSLFDNSNGAIGCIYFYEWSDVTRTPKTYYTLKAFENFLNDCQIYLASWQREVLSHMRHPYVACKKGEKNIIIKNSYIALRDAIEEGDEKKDKNPFIQTPSTVSSTGQRGSEDAEPYNVAITRPPSMRHMQPMFEPEGRWPEGGYFG